MCGINAIINFNEAKKDDIEIIKKMIKKINHRGFDSEGVFVSKEGCVKLAHNRLAITGIAEGEQPMVAEFKNKKFVIIFNGQIYNHKELKKELSEYDINKNSDTEVLLYAYIKWGEKSLQKLNGDFSFVIYDESMGEIFFARDRYGIKPFFYSFNNNEMIISSEVKAILESGKIKKEINFDALNEFFLGNIAFSSGSAPIDQSFFKNINQLPAGYFGRFSKKNGLKIEKYYDFISNNFIKKQEEYGEKIIINKIREKLDLAIKIRIPGEVKWATFLSGGLDSSIVTIMSKKFSENKIDSYGIKYKGEDSDDNYLARKISEIKKINFFDKDITQDEVFENIDKIIKSMDSPYGSIRQNGLFSIYKYAKEDKNKVILLGEGADEFSMGYFLSHPGFNLDLLKIKNSNDFEEILKNKIKISSRVFKNKINTKDIDVIMERYLNEYYNKDKNKRPLDGILNLYVKKFLPYRLEVNDRSAMSNTIESRVPFCDHNFAEESFKIPKKMNVVNGLEKIILRKAYIEEMPKDISKRNKKPTPEIFNKKIYFRLINELEKSILKDDEIWNILDKDEVQKIIKIIKKELGESENSLFNPKSRDMLFSKFSYRVKNIFAIYTIKRWYEIYFIENS